MFCCFRCTRDDDPSNKLWCSTRVDARGRHVTNAGNWGHCSETCNDIVINRQGNDFHDENILCPVCTVFPFPVLPMLHYKCSGHEFIVICRQHKSS